MEPLQIDLQDPKVAREVEKKQRLRDLAQKSGDKTCNSSDSRIPLGNVLAKKWLVMDLGVKPSRDVYNPWGPEGPEWKLRVSGEVATEREFTLQDLLALGLREYTAIDWHCVTGWSALDLTFQGVPLRALMQVVQPGESWKCLWQVAADGYTVNVHREDAEADEAFIAIYDGQGQLIPLEHGGIRLVVPSLFGWKSAKFLQEIQFLPHHPRGFWEKLGCHSRGRHVYNERWSEQAAGIWKVLIWIANKYQFVSFDFWFRLCALSGRVLGAVVDRLGMYRGQRVAVDKKAS